MTEIKTTAEVLESAVLRGAAMANGAAMEHQPFPHGFNLQPAPPKSEAQWAYERLILYIQNFESQLDNEHEVGMALAGAKVGTLLIQGIGFFAPDIVTFYGEDEQGGRLQLVQHVSQLNVMLVASPKREDEPNRIGFRLVQQLGDKVKEDTVAEK